MLLVLAPAAPAQVVGTKQPAPLPLKFGQPDPADFEAKNFVADSNAAAVVLCDYGATHYEDFSGMLRTVHERVVRLKILKKSGYSYASVSVNLHNRGTELERLSNLRGFTYVRQPDGSISQTKLETKAIPSELVHGRLSVQRFALPNVQEGAVIEYAYTVSSTFTGYLSGWSFQWNIPTRWSEYRVNFPRIYHYHITYQGYQPLDINEERTDTHMSLHLGARETMVPAEDHRWVVRNAPALRAEPFITTLADYRAHLSCELTGVQWPNHDYEDLRGDWGRKCQRLRQYEEFGQVLEHTDFLYEPVHPLVARYPDPRARAEAVRQLVMQQVKFDGAAHQWWTETPLRRTWERHHGSAADVNLLLVAALSQAELLTEPLLLSTRSHGAIMRDYAQLDQFDYVLALVTLPKGPEMLLDATEPLLPAGLLPANCLVEAGHTVPTQGEGRWVDLPTANNFTHYQQVQMTLDAQGHLSSQVREEMGGYAALAARRKLTELGEKKVLAETTDKHPDWEIPSYQFEAVADVSQPLRVQYTLRQAATTGPAPTELLVQPLAAFYDNQNHFRMAERRLPIDFGLLQQETIYLTLTLPPGYVAELPKPANIALPNQGGRYLYVANSPAPGTVQLMSRLTLDKPVYSPAEYGALREFYNRMLAKQAEALVIRKVGS